MPAKLHEIAQAAGIDPKRALLNSLPLGAKAFECFHSQVLVATYVAPEKTKGGIIRPNRSLEEDRFQGKVGLVLSKGPLAFKDDNVAKFGGKDIQPGDWVTYRPSDGTELGFLDDNGRDWVPCRLIEDVCVLGRTPDPALIY